MISVLLQLLAAAAAIAAVAALMWKLWEVCAPWVSWAFTTVYEIITAIPDWLLPFAAIAVVLALVGWGVKLL